MWPRTSNNQRTPDESDHALIARNGSTRITYTSPTLTDSQRVERLALLVADRISTEPKSLELDLSGVRRADTKIVASLIWLVRVSRHSHVRFVVHTSPSLEQVLALCRVSSLVDRA